MKHFRFLPACFLLLVGCMNADAGRGSDTLKAAEDDVTVEFGIENAQGNVTRNFRPGETARFIFEVNNHAAQSRQLAYTFPPHRVQVFSRSGGEPVWQAWQGQMFPQVMRNTTLDADGSTTFSIDWKIGADIAPGTYRIQPAFHGFVDDQPASPELPPVEISIE